ncbi:hypothetical protein TeGR_g39, partial [Tetraparma gracilis]
MAGRFVLSLVSASGVRGKDSSLQPYLKVKFGDAKIADSKSKATKSKTAKKAKAGGLVSFDNEKLVFDVHDPTSLADKEGKCFVEISLYDDNFFSDPVLCAARLDVTDIVQRPFFHGDGPKPVTVDLHNPGSTVDNGTLSLKVEFWKATPGVFRMIASKGVALRNVGSMLDKQDPYVYLSLGDKQAAK